MRQMTEITTFKGNWAEFPGEPRFMGRRLLKVERQRFDRACAFARKFRDLCRETDFDFNRKYLVVQNYRHDQNIDYDEIAKQWAKDPLAETPFYPDGGRVGDMVYFDCSIHADSRATYSYRSKYLDAEKTAMQITLGDGWQFDGIAVVFTMRCISIDGLHPCTGPYEWNLVHHSEPNRRFLQTLEDGFAELREKYLDNDGYKLRPLLEDEVAQFPNIDEDYCVSKVIPN